MFVHAESVDVTHDGVRNTRLRCAPAAGDQQVTVPDDADGVQREVCLGHRQPSRCSGHLSFHRRYITNRGLSAATKMTMTSLLRLSMVRLPSGHR